MADEIDNNETEGSMIERMMRGEFDDVEITESTESSEENTGDTAGSEDPAQAAVNNDDNSGDDISVGDDNNDDDTASVDADAAVDVDDLDTKDQGDGADSDNDDSTGDLADDDGSVNDPVDSDSGSKAETKDQSDGNGADNDEPNYKEEYEKLLNESKTYKDYYEKVTSEFTANGVKVKGFTDPEKTIQAMQAMYGLEDKFSKLKKYKKFHAPLEKRGMITDQAKFDLAMNIMDGDKEAIKAHMKNLNIDPIDMDLDEVNYQGTSTTSSDIELGLNDIIDASANAGIKNDVERVLYNDWDQDSVVDLLSTESSRNLFIEHMKPDANGNSIFKAVTAKAREMSVMNSGFADKNSIQKYNAALNELRIEQNEQSQKNSGSETASKPSVNDSLAEAQAAEAKKVAEASAAAVAKYKLEMEEKNRVADEARKKAASVSQNKTVKKSTKKEVDPMKLEGENFVDYWKQLTRAGL